MPHRQEFVIKDLAISIRADSAAGFASVWLPAEDTVPLPPWISPIAAIGVKGRLLESASRTIVKALESDAELESIALAFEGDPDGNPAIRRAIHEIGAAVLASAAYQPIGDGVGYPDPNSTLDTIPPTITPIVHTGIEMHRVSELPRLRKQLAVAVETLDRVAADLQPRGDEVKVVARQLNDAIKGLGK